MAGNVVWLDKVTATRALLKLSMSYDVAMANLQAAETNTAKHWSDSNEKEDGGGKGESKEYIRSTNIFAVVVKILRMLSWQLCWCISW